ncbi:MAG: hypothetical protein V9H25_23020 [Candidatus Competibacter sp.]
MQIQHSGPALCDLADRFRQIPFLSAFEERPLKSILSNSRILAYDPDETIIPRRRVRGSPLRVARRQGARGQKR